MKKKLLIALGMVLCAALLVAGSIAGTFAYLTSKDSVTNTFTFGKVAITLDEAPVDNNGDETTGDRVKENEYKLLPGHKYDKDPTIHVDSTSEDCWVFVKIENGLEDAEITTDATKTIKGQLAANDWTLVSGTTNVYAYKSVVSAGADVVAFETFTIDAKANVEDFKDATIVVTGYAVQADGFDSAEKAWTAAVGTGDIS